MLKKIMKYDLKWLLKIILIFNCLGLGFAVVGRLVDLLPDTIFFKVLSGICKGASISLIISGLVNGIIRSWVRMINNLYKDESYLFHTLPVSKNVHFLSKVLSSIIVIFMSMIVLLIGLFIMYYNENMIEMIKQSLNVISDSFNISAWLLIILLFLLLVVEVISIVLIGNFGIVYGFSHNQNKLVKTCLYGLVSYATLTFIFLIIIFIVSLFNKSIFDVVFKASNMNSSSLVILLTIGIIVYSIFTIALYFITNKKFNKGVNID